MKIRSTMITMTAVLGILALAPGAMGQDVIWTGGGDGTSWSDPLNWDGDATTATRLTLTAGSSSTVDVDTSLWTISSTSANSSISIRLADATVVLNVGDGGKLQGNAANRLGLSLAGGTFSQTGGDVNIRQRVTAVNGGTVEVSGGSYDNARWTYANGGTLHIIGSGATLVRHWDYMSGNNSAEHTIQRFTLDAGGVTPHTFGWTNQNPAGSTSTIKVDGIMNYLAGTGNVGDVIPLLVYRMTPPAYWEDMLMVEGGTGYVDGGLGFVTMSDTGATLTIIPEPGTIALLGLAGLAMFIRRRFVK